MLRFGDKKKILYNLLDKNYIYVLLKIMRDFIIIDYVGYGEFFGSFLCVL